MEEKERIITPTIIKKENNKKQKNRNPGIDLCRILGMLSIIIFHLNMPLYSKFKQYSNNIKYLEIITQWHISNFGIISGIVGFKTNKYSNLLYLWLTVFFYSASIHYIYKKYYKYLPYNFHRFNTEPKFMYIFPMIFRNYWYFSTYSGMYLFLPLINKGLSLVDKVELTIILISMIGIFFIWKDLMLTNPNDFCDDRSITPMVVFFLIGTYIGKYIINENKNEKNNKNIFYYIICIILFISSSYITYYSQFYFGNNKYILIIKKLFYNSINSIGIVIESLCIIFAFTQIKYNKTISKIISFLGPLCFSAYLIHNHKDLRGKIADYFLTKYSSSYSFKYVAFLSVLNGVKVFCACIIIDYFRFLVFKLFRIRKICIFFETLLFSFFKKIIGTKDKQ